MQPVFRIAIPVSCLLALLVAIAACGSAATPVPPTPQPTPTPFDTAALRSIIQEAVSQSGSTAAPAPAVDEEQLQAMIEAAIETSLANAGGLDLTAEQVEEMVQSAVESAAAPGVTLAEVEAAIAAALAAQTASQVADSEPLVLYSGRSESLVDAVIQQFSQATGIPVEVKYAGTSQLAATLLEEGDNSPADVFFAQDPGGWEPSKECCLLFPTVC